MKESHVPFPSLVQALCRLEAYPHHPANVEVRQTHISSVFLAGQFVYKIKKPVRFNFLDYSTLDKRRHFCKEEVRLNQRLAPDVYLGVVPVIEREGLIVLGEGSTISLSGRTVEYAVKMLRLPEERMLDLLVVAGKIGKHEIERLAAKLVAFHQRAAATHATVYGSAEAVWQKWHDSFSETERFVGDEIADQQYHIIRDFTETFLKEGKELFSARAQEGRVREGHGDLRAEHVCMTDGVIIFDCIEFNPGLRYCDVSSELAFLAMDLDFLGEPSLSNDLVAAYERLSGDTAVSLLQCFYKCYRAYVRGKVETLKSQEQEVPENERLKAKIQARRYFALAHRYAQGEPPPSCIVVCGLPGSGKSTVARVIRERTGFPLLSSDVVRKRLAGLKPIDHADEEFRKGIYAPTFTDLTYHTLVAAAQDFLKGQKGVIIDATFRDSNHRRLFMDLAARNHVPILFVECRAEDKEILRRLEVRAQMPGGASDATKETYLRQRKEFMPLTDVPSDSYLIVKTDSSILGTLEKLENLLYRST